MTENEPIIEEINEMYAEAGLSTDTVELLHRYFTAFVNLYGIINLADAYKIIEKQNPGMITFDKLYEFSRVVAFENNFFYIIDPDEMYSNVEATPETREIVADYLLVNNEDDYYEMKEHQYNKPLYIPEKEVLLKYEDELYYEQTPQVKTLEEFLIKNHITDEDLQDVMMELHLVINLGEKVLEYAISTIEDYDIQLTDSDYEVFLKLFADVSNHSRIPANRGYMPAELCRLMPAPDRPPEIIIGDNIKQLLNSGKISGADFLDSIADSDFPFETKLSLLNQFAEISGTKPAAAPQKQISKNAPCPCGSGKKYKRCCGKE